MNTADFLLLAQATQAVGSAQPAAVLATGDGGPDIALWRVLGALLICLMLAVAAALVVKRRLGVSATSLFQRPVSVRLRMVERISLGPQSSLALVTIDNVEFVVAASPQAIAIHRVGSSGDNERIPA